MSEMITYCCDRCKKAIEEDDIEAIEVKQIKYRMLFSNKSKEFKPVRQNTVNENQNHHYCGECKGDFYELI
jgi:hypothetical protein